MQNVRSGGEVARDWTDWGGAGAKHSTVPLKRASQVIAAAADSTPLHSTTQIMMSKADPTNAVLCC